MLTYLALREAAVELTGPEVHQAQDDTDAMRAGLCAHKDLPPLEHMTAGKQERTRTRFLKVRRHSAATMASLSSSWFERMRMNSCVRLLVTWDIHISDADHPYRLKIHSTHHRHLHEHTYKPHPSC